MNKMTNIEAAVQLGMASGVKPDPNHNTFKYSPRRRPSGFIGIRNECNNKINKICKYRFEETFKGIISVNKDILK